MSDYHEPRWFGRTAWRWRYDIGWGIVFGASMAAYYTVISLAIYLFQGSTPFEAQGITIGRAVATYWVAGCACGVVLGLVMPLGRNAIGGGVVGAIVAVPAFAAISLSSGDLHWVPIIMSALLIGVPAGVVLSSGGGPSWDDMYHLDQTGELPASLSDPEKSSETDESGR